MIFVRNVLRAKARSIMTALGVAVGVALFVAITAITTDLRRQIDSAASGYNLEIVVYERRATSAFSSRISQETMAALQAHVGPALTPMVVGTLNERWNPYALVLGAPEDFMRRIPLTAGTRLAPGTDECLLGEVAAQKLGIGPGSQITLDGRAMRVTGLFRTGSRLFDGGAMTDLASAQRMLARDGAAPFFTLGLMQSRRAGSTDADIADINRAFPTLKAIPGTEFAGSLRLMRVVAAFVSTISVIAFIGTCLVVSNTVIMAIAERTREIGILMTIGWTPWLVLRMLAAESLLLCAAGAVLGDLLALGLLRLLNSLDSVGFGWIPVRFPMELAATSVAMSAGVALVSLLWPAFIVWRLQPLSALRHE